MTDSVLDLDYARELDQLTRDDLMSLAVRIERSTTAEQLIYRELEIDQIWRLLDQGARVPELNASQQDRFAAQIERIHDLVGIDHDVQSAAAQLRAMLADH